jgi:hypothetical protein
VVTTATSAKKGESPHIKDFSQMCSLQFKNSAELKLNTRNNKGMMTERIELLWSRENLKN